MPSNVISISLSGYPVVLASAALEQMEKFGYDTSLIDGRANSYRCPLGVDPGVACLLMLRKSLNDLTASSFKSIKFAVGAETLTVPELCLNRAYRVLPGRSHDERALYLVELYDKRWLLKRTGIINKRYNVREWEDADGAYRSGTENDATEEPWTWTEILEDLWDELDPDLAGAYTFTDVEPTLDSTPENLFYENISAWEALGDVAHRIGCELKLDPGTGTISIIQMGTTDDDPAAYSDAGGTWTSDVPGWSELSPSRTVRTQTDRLMEDFEVFLGPWVLPEKVRVVFPTNFPNHETKGSGHSVVITGSTVDTENDFGHPPEGEAYGGTEQIIHDAMTARFLNATDSSPENQSELQDRAEEVARSYYLRLMAGTPEMLEFSGVRLVYPGKHIHAVTWGEIGNGLKTTVERTFPSSPPPMVRKDFPVRTSRGVKYLGVRIENDEGTISLDGNFQRDGNDAIGGTYKLSWRGKRTDAIDITANGSAVQAKLEALSNIGAGNITVTGGPLTDDDLVIYFSGDLFEEDAAEIMVHYGKVTGGYLPNLSVGDEVPCAVLSLGGQVSYDVILANLTSEHWAPGLRSTAVRDLDDWYTSPSYVLYACNHGGYDEDDNLLVTFGVDLAAGEMEYSRAENISSEDDADWEDQNRDLWGYPFNGLWKVLPQDCPPEDQ